jgi:hypothetical protein
MLPSITFQNGAKFKMDIKNRHFDFARLFYLSRKHLCSYRIKKIKKTLFFELVVQGVFGDDSQVFAYYS